MRSSTSADDRPAAASADLMLATGSLRWVGTLIERTSPVAGSRATRSVKVPPMSMPTCQPLMVFPTAGVPPAHERAPSKDPNTPCFMACQIARGDVQHDYIGRM